MATFTIDRQLLARLDSIASARGTRRSDLVRQALDQCRRLEPVAMGKGYLSIALDRIELAKLDGLALEADLNRSQALSVLLEQTLDRWTETPVTEARKKSTGKRTTKKSKSSAKKRTAQERVTLPGPRALRSWSVLLMEAAHSVTGRGRYGDRKVFISAALDALIRRTNPEHPNVVRTEVRAMLPELNRRDYIALHRADLVSEMPPDLVGASELQHGHVTWHFIELR